MRREPVKRPAQKHLSQGVMYSSAVQDEEGKPLLKGIVTAVRSIRQTIWAIGPFHLIEQKFAGLTYHNIGHTGKHFKGGDNITVVFIKRLE